MPRGRLPTAMRATTLPRCGSTITTSPPVSSETYRRSGAPRAGAAATPEDSKVAASSAAAAATRDPVSTLVFGLIPGSVRDHAPDRGARVHQIEGVVDLIERHLVRDQRIDGDLLLHVPVHDLRYVGAPAGAAEGGALPYTARDQLEGTGLDLLARAGYADDDRHAPAAVTAFERLTHQIHVADAFEAVVRPPVGERHEVRYQIALDLLGVHEMRHAEFLTQRLAIGVEIDTDDLVGARETRALHHVEADAAETEHDYVRAGFDLGGIDHGADAGGHAAADVADLVEGGVLADLRHRNLGQYGEVGERRAAQIGRA